MRKLRTNVYWRKQAWHSKEAVFGGFKVKYLLALRQTLLAPFYCTSRKSVILIWGCLFGGERTESCMVFFVFYIGFRNWWKNAVRWFKHIVDARKIFVTSGQGGLSQILLKRLKQFKSFKYLNIINAGCSWLISSNVAKLILKLKDRQTKTIIRSMQLI